MGGFRETTPGVPFADGPPVLPPDLEIEGELFPLQQRAPINEEKQGHHNQA
jgi:hypothetical protein